MKKPDIFEIEIIRIVNNANAILSFMNKIIRSEVIASDPFLCFLNAILLAFAFCYGYRYLSGADR